MLRSSATDGRNSLILKLQKLCEISFKKQMLQQLKKTPIIQVTCEKLGIARATFYRWKQRDQKFSSAVDKALHEGSLLINDMAESQLITQIKNANLTAIIFWLKYHHRGYTKEVLATLPNPPTKIKVEIIRSKSDLENSDKKEVRKVS